MGDVYRARDSRRIIPASEIAVTPAGIGHSSRPPWTTNAFLGLMAAQPRRNPGEITPSQAFTICGTSVP